MHAWQSMHPPVQCHDEGWLAVGNGHAIHWEVSGNPLGAPALFLHGGPGAGCKADDRRWFDPAHYRIVLFDQRGAGRSRPRGALQHNTTQHLVDDIEALREALGIQDWLLFGGSWGATLALAYAQQHPSRVRAMVLRGVFLATARERDWLFGDGGAAAQFPDAARAFLAVGALQDYDRRLAQGDVTAARAWLDWEQELMRRESWIPHQVRDDGVPDDHALASARIGVHYARSSWFLQEGQLLRDAPALRPISAVIVQGQRDLVTPPQAALSLHAAWPDAKLVLLPDAGHASSDPAMAGELVAATDRFRT
jgi:proline iminopeptidase